MIHEKIVHGDRILEIPGTINARDIFANSDMPLEFRGKFFRSAMLNRLSSKGQAALKDLGVEVVIDLRTKKEVQVDGAARVPHGIEVFVLDQLINPDTPTVQDYSDPNYLIKRANSVDEQIEIGLRGMRHVYWKFVMAPHYQERFAEALKVAADYSKVWFNCSAGKDRTGFFAYLIHSIAKTPKPQIFYDYMMSFAVRDLYADFFEYDSEHAEKSILETVFTVRPEFLQYSLDTIKENFSSVDGYFEQIGVDSVVQDKIKNNLEEK
ncbi:MAG: tyrosine-protein phosphatase [Bifidobacteriaceae bacterium]|jgi:protein-tyrosine phosphatase|nr:tyrosine-protein phosphatase [Bifidobacteriaceae bacterium]